jgi:hypothetical protein
MQSEYQVRDFQAHRRIEARNGSPEGPTGEKAGYHLRGPERLVALHVS